MKEATVNLALKLVPFIAVITCVIIGIICTPLLTIAMVNLLFPAAAIPYGFVQWCAVMVLLLILKFEVSIKS